LSWIGPGGQIIPGPNGCRNHSHRRWVTRRHGFDGFDDPGPIKPGVVQGVIHTPKSDGTEREAAGNPGAGYERKVQGWKAPGKGLVTKAWISQSHEAPNGRVEVGGSRPTPASLPKVVAASAYARRTGSGWPIGSAKWLVQPER